MSHLNSISKHARAGFDEAIACEVFFNIMPFSFVRQKLQTVPIQEDELVNIYDPKGSSPRRDCVSGKAGWFGLTSPLLEGQKAGQHHPSQIGFEERARQAPGEGSEKEFPKGGS